MRRVMQQYFAGLLLSGLAISFAHANLDAPSADTETSALIYRSPEERRDAGLGREILPWLSASGLLEIEREWITPSFTEVGQRNEDSETVYTLQLGLEMDFSDTVSAQITMEAERANTTTSRLEEAILLIELAPFELELGRLSIPFGEYYSHFVSGPMLEFGETIAEGAKLAWQLSERFEISGTAIRSAASATDRSLEWATNVEYVSRDEAIKFGVSYLSDLASSDEHLLEEVARPSGRTVGAWNAYALFGFESMEFTAEYVGAATSFVDLEATVDRPRALNFEWAYFFNDRTQFAVRYETSRELEDAPESQWGVNWTWRPNQTMLLSLDYLRADFAPEFVFDDDDNAQLRSQTIAAQVALEF